MQTIESLKIRMDQSDRRHNETSETLKEFKAALDSKVPYKTYRAELGILLTIIIVIFTFIASEIEALRSDGSQVKNQVSYMSGIFHQNNLEIQK